MTAIARFSYRLSSPHPREDDTTTFEIEGVSRVDHIFRAIRTTSRRRAGRVPGWPGKVQLDTRSPRALSCSLPAGAPLRVPRQARAAGSMES
jgi:hypothetical protein